MGKGSEDGPQIRNSKSKIRSHTAALLFGFRISDFGFRISAAVSKPAGNTAKAPRKIVAGGDCFGNRRFDRAGHGTAAAEHTLPRSPLSVRREHGRRPARHADQTK